VFVFISHDWNYGLIRVVMSRSVVYIVRSVVSKLGGNCDRADRSTKLCTNVY